MLAICTTVRGLDHNFLDWLNHFSRIGIEKFYVFLDAPDEDSQFLDSLPLSLKSKIEIIAHDLKLKVKYLDNPDFYQFKDVIDNLVEARQVLNVNIALEKSLIDGINWLIHLDADELIGFPSADDYLKDYLLNLPEHVDSYVFPTMEAVPRSLEIKNCFREITHFKVSTYLLSFHKLDQLMHGWRERNNKFPLFNAHVHGKAAFRVSKFKEHFTPYSVHEFVPYRWSSGVMVSQTWEQPFLYHFPFSGLSMLRKRFTGINNKRIQTYDRGVFGYNFYEEAQRFIDNNLDLEQLYIKRIMCGEDFEYLEKYGYICVKNFGVKL
jgi:hypothetical protein